MRVHLLLFCVGIVFPLGFPLTGGAAGSAPNPKLCGNTANPPQDVVVEGGCIAIIRTKGNCHACHHVAGIASGNIAPPLVAIAERFPDKAKLRAQIEDPLRFNPHTVMPPYGKHDILTPQEIDKLLVWLLTL
jgi:sulfur-oxidizing protein SoxX